MWQTRHCRHCGQKHVKVAPESVKKYDKEKLLVLVREFVLEKIEKQDGTFWGRRFFKEEIARKLRAKTSLVEHCLHKLNLEGLVEQPVHYAPHDSTRDYAFNRYHTANPWGDSAWMGDIYAVKDNGTTIQVGG